LAGHRWAELHLTVGNAAQRPAAGSSVERCWGGRSLVGRYLAVGNAGHCLAAGSLESPGEDMPDRGKRNPDMSLALHSADSLAAGAFPGSRAREMDAGLLRDHGTGGIAGWAGFGSEAADTDFADGLRVAARIGGGIPGAVGSYAGRAKGVGDSDFD
jgi:hypothetical protein